LLLAGLILCAKNFNSQFGEKRIQAAMFSIAIIIPIAANMLYVFDWFEIVFGFDPPFDITPMSCTLSLMLFAIATFRYRFFDDVKIARRTAVDLIPEGILLVDANSRIIDFNTTFKNMLENGELCAADSCAIITGPVKRPLTLYDRADFIQDVIKPWDGVYQTEKGCFYKAVRRPITSNGRIYGAFIWFVDLTIKQNVLHCLVSRNTELEKLNKRLEEQALIICNLAIARTRNFIAAEMHDILGHSIILAISLLEVARFSSDKETFDLNQCIGKTEILLKNCLLKIENSILGQPNKMADQHSLIDRLNILFDEVRPASVFIDLSISGNPPKLPRQYEDTIFKICREGITNAIRHGKADKVNIILRFLSNNYETYIIDNGIGCNHVKKGMGLTGMEARTKTLNGKLLYSSVGGQGFCVQMLLPVI
jgi:signal transduction histidine kinase